jgi:3' exoribonuclease family, domain 1
MAPVANSWSYGDLARIATPSSAKAKEAAASASRARRDERTARDELRPIYLRGAVLSGAAGSAYYEAGATKLFCAVHGPRAAGSGAPADAAAAQLACEVRWAGFARAAGVDTRAGSGPGAATGAAADRERDAGFATDE